MLPRTFGTLAGFVFAIGLVVGACTSSPATPAPPTPPTPPATLRAAIVVASISVTGERAAAGGYAYRVVLHLRETGGVAATISAVDLAFVNDAGTATSARYDQVMAGTSNVCPANGTADTREFVTADANAAHAFAQSVRATVTYTDTAATAGTATGSTNIPPLGNPPPVDSTLTGVITDVATGAGIQGARVEALNGANAGKAVTTDGSGAYALTGLTAETFRMRASATGYDSGEQNVTVPDVPRADMALRRPGGGGGTGGGGDGGGGGGGGPCAYTVSPTGRIDLSHGLKQLSLIITRTSGTCGWTAASDVSWITLASASGSGDATVGFTVGNNVTFVGRAGHVTVEWSGGQSQLMVVQDPDIPAACSTVVTVNGQTTLSVPKTASGPYTTFATSFSGPGSCGPWSASASPEITFSSPTSGSSMPAQLTFSVAANTSTNARTLSVGVAVGGSASFVTINQAAGP